MGIGFKQLIPIFNTKKHYCCDHYANSRHITKLPVLQSEFTIANQTSNYNEGMSFLPYPPPPEPGWYDDDATVMPPFADSAMPGTVQSQPMEQVSMLLEPINDESVNDEPANDDDIDWDGTVLSSAFTMKHPKLEYTLYNEQTGQEVIIDMGVLLGRKSSVEVPEGAKSVKLEDPTLTISRHHAAISFDQDGTLWIEDYESLNGTYIIQGNEETKVEHKPIKFEVPCTIRIGDQFFTLEQR